jgi:hypothetical protein
MRRPDATRRDIEAVATGDLQVLNLAEQAMRGDVGQHTNRLTRASGAPVFGAPSGVTGAVEGGVAAPVVPPAAPPPSVLVARAEKRLINATLADVDGNRPVLRFNPATSPARQSTPTPGVRSSRWRRAHHRSRSTR